LIQISQLANVMNFAVQSDPQSSHCSASSR
jgi:hypothetical protein